MKTIECQSREILERFPTFRSVLVHGWVGIWEGELRTPCRSYKVRVMMTLPWSIGNFDVACQRPQIWVVDPLLRRRPNEPDVAIPHIFSYGYPEEFPRLCLFDPRADEWDFSASIADTILLWAVQWLACYEAWYATGEWYGGGHVWTPDELIPHENIPSSDKPRRPVPSVSRIRKAEAKIGTAGSLLVMEASVEGSFMPLHPYRWRCLGFTGQASKELAADWMCRDVCEGGSNARSRE